MSEAYETAKLRKSLQNAGFYVKKLADRTTRGLPDCFIAKDGIGIFAEIKYYEKINLPENFKYWSSIATGVKMLQLTTLVELERHFRAVYIFIYRLNNGETYYIIESPLRLLEHERTKSLMKFNNRFETKNDFILNSLESLFGQEKINE